MSNQSSIEFYLISSIYVDAEEKLLKRMVYQTGFWNSPWPHSAILILTFPNIANLSKEESITTAMVKFGMKLTG